MTTQAFLDCLQGVKGHAPQWTAKCPTHDDRTASLSVSEKDGKVLAHCQAGCHIEAVVGAVGLTMSDLFVDPPATAKAPTRAVKPIVSYVYTDAQGKPLYRVCRKEPKGFHQERYEHGEWIPGLNNMQTVLYRLPEVLEAVKTGAHVYIVEGEKDVDALVSLGLCATCNPMGAGKWKPQYTDSLKGASVIIIPDNDEPGLKHAQTVAATLHGTAASVKVFDLTNVWKELPPKGDASDFIQHLGMEKAKQAFVDVPKGLPEWVADATFNDTTPKVVCLASIPYEKPRFLLAPYLPLGKLTIFQGDSGVGKTIFACALAAAVSTGSTVCGIPCDQRNVLLVSVEDDAGLLRGRIEEGGGDLSRCSVLDNASGVTLSDEKIEGFIRDSNAGLVIFDPLQAFLGAKVDMFRANEVRPVLARLADIAKRTDCAICFICHMAKGQTKAVYRALGSVDFTAATRSALQIGRDPNNPEECVAVHFKCSNARNGRALRYEIGGKIGSATWIGLCDLTTDDLDRAATRIAKGIPYEDEPLVAVIRSLITDNPSGVFLSYDEIQSYAIQLLGYAPCADGNAWREGLKTLTAEAIRKDRVQIDLIKARPKAFHRFGELFTPYSTSATRGVRLQPHSPPRAFQTAL